MQLHPRLHPEETADSLASAKVDAATEVGLYAAEPNPCCLPLSHYEYMPLFAYADHGSVADGVSLGDALAALRVARHHLDDVGAGSTLVVVGRQTGADPQPAVGRQVRSYARCVHRLRHVHVPRHLQYVHPRSISQSITN